MLDLAEIALEAAAGPIGGLDHDVEDGGMLHGACGTFRGAFTQGRRSFNHSLAPLGRGWRGRTSDLARGGAERKAAPLAGTLKRADLSPVGRGDGICAGTDRFILAALSCARALPTTTTPFPKISSPPAKKRERSAERRMPTIAAMQTSAPFARSSAFGAAARLSGRARLPALCCGTRQGERIRRWLSSSSRVS